MTALATRPLGSSGIEASVVGLGCNNFGRRNDLAATRAVVDRAIEEGITFLDTADVYGDKGGSETYLGEVLHGRRDKVILATKFGMPMSDGDPGPRGRPEYVRKAVTASLQRLQTDVIDFYWYHRPDGQTPIAETLGALDELVQAGTVRAIGASNFSAAQIEEADAAARADHLTRFTAIQNEYSLVARQAEHEVLPTCVRLDIGFVPYFPLASGLLTGKYHRGEPGPAGARLTERGFTPSDQQFELVEALQEYADERGLKVTDVAIGALIAHPGISTVIAGATRPEQVVGNAAAARWEPGEDDFAALSQLLEAHGWTRSSTSHR